MTLFHKGCCKVGWLFGGKIASLLPLYFSKHFKILILKWKMKPVQKKMWEKTFITQD